MGNALWFSPAQYGEFKPSGLTLPSCGSQTTEAGRLQEIPFPNKLLWQFPKVLMFGQVMAEGPGHCPPTWRPKGGDGTHRCHGKSPRWGLVALEVLSVPQGDLGGLWRERGLLRGAGWGITKALGSAAAGVTMGCDPPRDMGLFGLGAGRQY